MDDQERDIHLSYIENARKRRNQMECLLNEVNDPKSSLAIKISGYIKEMDEKIAEALLELGSS